MANGEIDNFKLVSERLAKEGKLEEIPQIANQEVLKRSYDTLDAFEKRKKLEDKVWSNTDKALLGIPALYIALGLVPIKRGYSTARKGLKDLSQAKEKFVDLVLGVRIDWKEKPPKEEELITFSQGLSYLPPIGGKIPLMWDQAGVMHRYGTLEHTLTAEQQASKVINLRQKKLLGEIFVHQLTVQGRLPDEFKYVALALILNSPYQNDWAKPFFESPWGKIAPLIHDGGRVDVAYNPVWQEVSGRTDFLQRISEIHEPQLEEMERLDIEEVRKLSVDRLARARAEQEERNRLLIEARAYQRLALALHCRIGTAPKAIPKAIRFKLCNLSNNFEKGIDLLLKEYGIHGAAEVEWFREDPVEVLDWSEKRSEAEWPPIQKQLIALEEVREKNPELRGRVTKLLIDTSDQIDREIGLLPKTEDPQS